MIDAEDPMAGVLYEYVHERYMPPEDEGELSDQEIRTITKWLESGAKLPGELDQAVAVNQHDVLPILRLRCSVCHGARRREAELDVRTVQSLTQGGKSGPAIVAGDPDASRILQRIHAGEMPPRRELASASVKPMTDLEVERLTEWIAAGTPEANIDPDVAATKQPDTLVNDADRQFWAFQPPRKEPIPRVADAQQVRTSIDAFLLRKLAAAGLSFSPLADRRTLIRRAHFDLIGLPPSPGQVQQFLTDDKPGAYERMIDRLLASPHYGERWGQHWLDLAGYSDSEGGQHADAIRKHAYRYRDYVIRAFNADNPYDRFLLEQIAGDELADYESAEEITPEIYDNLVATGFLRLAPDGSYAPITSFVPDRLEIIDDELEVFSSAVLGLTIKCARCHSHKFDPLPQRDYYRLAAVFKGAWDEHDWLIPTRQSQPPGERDRYLPFVPQSEMDAWKAAGGKSEDQPLVRALWDRGEPSPTYLLQRGNYQTPTRLVGPGCAERADRWPDAV